MGFQGSNLVSLVQGKHCTIAFASFHFISRRKSSLKDDNLPKVIYIYLAKELQSFYGFILITVNSIKIYRIK